MTQKQVADNTGGKFVQSEIARFEAPGDRPSSRPVTHEVLWVLEDALGVPHGTVETEAGRVEVGPMSTERALQVDPFLSDDERAVFLELYRAAKARSERAAERPRPRRRNVQEHGLRAADDEAGSN